MSCRSSRSSCRSLSSACFRYSTSVPVAYHRVTFPFQLQATLRRSLKREKAGAGIQRSGVPASACGSAARQPAVSCGIAAHPADAAGVDAAPLALRAPRPPRRRHARWRRNTAAAPPCVRLGARRFGTPNRQCVNSSWLRRAAPTTSDGPASVMRTPRRVVPRNAGI